MAVKEIGEFDFREFIRCPLRLEGASGYHEAAELEAGKESVQWMLQRAFAGGFTAGDIPTLGGMPTLAEMRACYEGKVLQLLGGAGAGRRREGLRGVATAARRMRALTVNFEVLSPVTAYELAFGRNRVRGTYAVVTVPQREHEPLILRLRWGREGHPSARRGPDVVNMLRWAHFRQWEPEYLRACILNYRLDAEESWKEFYQEPVVRGYLNHAAANLADGRWFPNPGEHCDSCQKAACREAELALPGRRG